MGRHLRVLREAGLVEERRDPRDRRVQLYALRAEPVRELAGWLEAVAGRWQSQLDAFQDYVAVRAGGGPARRP